MSTARPTRPPRAAPAIGLAAALAGLWARAQAPLPSVALRGGVSAVTPAPSPVVRVGAGTFLMGSDPAGLDQARTMCLRELERFAAVRGAPVADPVVREGYNILLMVCRVDPFRTPSPRAGWSISRTRRWRTRCGCPRTASTARR